MRVFLDTNSLLDVLLNRPEFVAESEAVILACERADDPMFIAWHGLATTHYLLRRGRTEACGADCIVTRNGSDFTKSNIVAMMPSEFLAKFP